MSVAVIIGSTGLTGTQLLSELLSDPAYTKVISISRKKIEVTAPHLEQILIDLDTLSQLQGAFRADVAFCCLGTTMKKAGSKEAFLKVDQEYVLEFAKLCKANHVKRLLYISSIGANPDSSNFYLHTKGVVEQSIMQMGFDASVAFRPSFLDGKRDEQRMGERVGLVLARAIRFLMIGPLKKYRATDIRMLTKKMRSYAHMDSQGNFIIENDKIISNE